MKVTLSFEETSSSDVSIMVDVLRASTTITAALDKFSKIIPCFTPEDAFKLKSEVGGVIAGERKGAKIEGFDIGNSPTAINDFSTDADTLILTTSNGTRILEKMNSTVLIGCLNNAEAVAEASLKVAESHIDLVMAGVWEKFAIEDFLAAGEIIHQISKKCEECEISEYAKSAVLASRDFEEVKKAFYESTSGNKLKGLGYEDDIAYSLAKNSSKNVGIYENNIIKVLL
ncbi:2-phosphosulfolactate phosphatase [Methanobrevibacter millerae]|uniref:2-phosphosulfolactate phosphatase n=1 Tax=Methanobrevibacter millerae TaxID=230361 RepID=A0A1G5WU59_9EURY|nr:2-phosphosulfolactate phosphatase [Methanobrevibacter millerae]SDA61470.1 2-phosphosulfolactate phosphatase [Methanobrevibacter millerae]